MQQQMGMMDRSMPNNMNSNMQMPGGISGNTNQSDLAAIQRQLDQLQMQMQNNMQMQQMQQMGMMGMMGMM